MDDPARHNTAGTRGVMLVIAAVALAGLGLLAVVAPAYLSVQGFPLDDAWIHAVYARSLARTGMLAYNPGVPATGATSPLWACLVAIPQALGTSVDAAVWLTKVLGFGLHVLATLALFAALRPPSSRPGTLMVPLAAALLVAFHPDLVSASVSGMEVSLAALLASGLLLLARRGRPVVYGVASALAPLARPELAILCYLLPLALYARRDRRRLLVLGGAAALGNAVAFGGNALRNLAVSGLPLPATFYAKVGAGRLPLADAELAGFRDLLGHIAVVDSLLLLVLLAGIALWIVISDSEDADRGPAAALIGGLAFCGVSFALVRPIDPAAFYHQRYVLPVVPFLVAAAPLLVADALRGHAPPRIGRVATWGVLAVLASTLVLGAPGRYERLSNDARNIDDVQVSLGHTLASVEPSTVVWAVDAGAIRYFGRAFVIDMMGLNDARLLGPQAQTFLDSHPPAFIEVVPTWSTLDPASAERLDGTLFEPSTGYTVTSFLEMRRHWLVRCPAGFAGGEFVFLGRTFRFSCAAAPGSASPAS